MTPVEKRFLTGFRSEDADTPGLVQEDDGTVWLVAPDGTRTQISGGGFMPARSVGQATFEAHNVVAAGSDFTHVPWVFTQGDEDMIDLTTPTLPVPVDGGVYAYLFTITQQAGGDGSPFYGTLVVDSDFYAVIVEDSRLGLASSEYPQANLPLVAPPWFSAAGSGFQATIGNGGFAGSDTFDAQLYVQRIT